METIVGCSECALFIPLTDTKTSSRVTAPEEGRDGALIFGLTAGIFKQICSDAEDEDKLQFYLLIDEINRGDIPRVFGELLTLLERDKRGKSVHLPVSGERF